MIFNDERIRSHFDLRIWVCVSVDFNVRGIIKAIIESATGEPFEDLDLEPLQRRLQNILNEKRYLLVLDDVWSDDQEKWDKLKYVLACGSRGASIIVTTRIVMVASTMGTMPLHQLSGLNKDDSWSLFKERAFRDKKEENSNLMALGKNIVKKCAGVPLAIKSLGSMMSYKNEESQWLSVANSELWNLSQYENLILPALQLSYSNLPSKLRQCFGYCAIFPKNFLIERELLIQLWMANGFIPLTGMLEPEVIGNEICNELCWRSFLQEPEEDNYGNIKGFKMHDLIHDLAQSIMEDECLNKTVASSANISKNIFHFAMVETKMSSCSFLKSLYQVETLRTFLVHKLHGSPLKVPWDFSNLSSLRALGARYTQLTKLSSSISRLPHLRYLDLSHTKIKRLPKSVLTLYNLQTLRLEHCYYLEKLPKHMRLLKNLRHFHLDGCPKLSQMPSQIGQITCLKTLTCFIVGKKRGCHLDELKSLNLGGSLHIKHLQRVKNSLDAKEANVVGKQNLHQLYLCWEDESDHQSLEDVEKVLEALQPQANLKKFCISGYNGAQFPFWVRDNILNNIIHIQLLRRHNCSQLPPLALLPSLRNLHIHQMSQVVYIDDSDQNGGTTTRFPSLKSLKIDDLPNLQRFSREEGRELLPCLTSLQIDSCPKLSLPRLPSVKQLKVWNCTEVILGSISNLKNLISLSVSYNDELNCLPHGMLINLSSLKKLQISDFEKLKCLPTELVGLSALETLQISYCPELMGLPDGIKRLTSLWHLKLSGSCWSKLEVLPEALRYVPALQYLSISEYPNLESLPHWIGDLISLQLLSICRCPKLSSLPASIQSLTNLQNLIIRGCPELEKRCEKETGENWYKIAHIPNVHTTTSYLVTQQGKEFGCVGRQLKAISKLI